MSEEEKIIDLENEISFLKDALCEKQKEIEELNTELEIRIKWQQYFEKEYVNKDKIREIRDKAEVMDYYSLNDVIDDLSKLIGDYEEDEGGRKRSN